MKYVYSFGAGKAEGDGAMKDVLGGKGAGLAEMTRIGLPVPAGFTISAAIDPATHSLHDLVPPGMLIAAPFRTSQTQGSVLVYPRREGAFTTT